MQHAAIRVAFVTCNSSTNRYHQHSVTNDEIQMYNLYAQGMQDATSISRISCRNYCIQLEAIGAAPELYSVLYHRLRTTPRPGKKRGFVRNVR
jgi:hypothetical protein